jgi:hypothetical protein
MGADSTQFNYVDTFTDSSGVKIVFDATKYASSASCPFDIYAAQ